MGDGIGVFGIGGYEYCVDGCQLEKTRMVFEMSMGDFGIWFLIYLGFVIFCG